MRAAQINDYGDKDVLKSVDDAPKPLIDEEQALVEVHAAAVNPFDVKVRKGIAKAGRLPAILGGDFAGVIADVGTSVHDWKIGDEVYGQANAMGGQGSYAEYVPVKAGSIGRKPSTVDFTVAAALPLAGVSAYQALVDHANVLAGQKVLIHGGAGGIGSFAIQLAKYLRAHVATTALTSDADYLRALGADEVIDYKTQDFSTMLSDFDVVYDTVGGETYAKSFQILKPGGVIVSMIEQPNEELMAKHEVQVISQFTRVTTERLEKLARLVEKGAIKVNVDKTFLLEQASEALAYLESGSHRGKIVIQVK